MAAGVVDYSRAMSAIARDHRGGAMLGQRHGLGDLMPVRVNNRFTLPRLGISHTFPLHQDHNGSEGIMKSELSYASHNVSIGQHAAVGGVASSALLVIIILYFWIGLSPFPSLGDLTPSAQLNSSNTLNQLVMITVSLSVIFVVSSHPASGSVRKFFSFMFVIFLWLAIVSLFSIDPIFSLRRLAYALLTCICACGVLLLPRDGASFAKLMALCLLIVLGLCYFGVTTMPYRSIHQASDALEPELAGDWRGYFLHKNTASAAMVYTVFLALYIWKRHSIGLGALIFVLATVFLWKTGGKTSAALVPATLVVTWAFERAGPFRLLIVGGIIGLMNFILMSAAVSPPMQEFLQSNGIDPTFTDRAAIWRIALSAIADSPLIGYGFQSFWDTDAVYSSDTSMSSWAVLATSAHNGYVELALHGGLPLLALMVVWLVILPCRHSRIAIERNVQPDLTRLFIRIWLFSVFLGCLESAFLSGEQMWFMTLVSLFGLRLQAYAKPVQSASVRPVGARSRPARRATIPPHRSARAGSSPAGRQVAMPYSGR